MKKIIVFLSIALTLGYSLFSFFQSKTEPLKATDMGMVKAATTTVLPPSLLPNHPTYDVSSATQNLPSQVFSYVFQDRNINTILSEIKNWFALSGQTNVISGGSGTYHIIKNAETSLIVGRYPLHIAYNNTQTPTGTLQIADTVFDAAARDFMTTKLLPASASISQAENTYLNLNDLESPGVPRSQASGIRLIYHPLLDALPLRNTQGHPAVITFEYDRNSKLHAFSSTNYRLLQKQNTGLQVIPYSEAVQRLVSGAESVVSVTSTQAVPASYAITTVKIREVTLQYLMVPNKSNLYVVYTFSGTAQDTQTGQAYEVTTLVSGQ